MHDKYGVGQDKDCYPGSDVLLNLLYTTDGRILAEAEAAFTSLRLRQYDFPVFQTFTLETLKNIHFYLFQDVYAWAGELRTLDISKGHTRFATWSRIQPEADKLFDRLKQEQYLTKLGKNSLSSAWLTISAN